MIRGDASEVYTLANDLEQVGRRTVPAVRAGMSAVGELMAKAARNNAIQTSGVHAKHYPDSWDSELTFSIATVTVEFGPNVDKKQGILGRALEFGGRRSPAHLDGAKALSANEHRAEVVLDQYVHPLFP